MSKLKFNRIVVVGMGYVLGGILIKGIAFVTTPIFTRLLTPQEFGELNRYLSYEAILAMVLGFQFSASFKIAKLEFKDNENGLEKYFTNTIVLLLLHSTLALLAVNIFSGFIIEKTGIDSVLLWNLMILNCLGNALVTVYNSYVSVKYQYKKYILIASLNAILNVLISLVLIFTFMNHNRSNARILGYVIPYVLISSYIILGAFRKSRPTAAGSRAYTSTAYKYCAPLIPAGFADVMVGQFGKLTVDRHYGSLSMGVYSLSYNVYSIIGIIRIAMDYVVGPFFFDKRFSDDIESIKKIIRVYSRLLAGVSAIIMIVSTEIIRILGSAEYFEARKSAIPLIAASYFVFLCSTVSQEEYYQKKTHMVSLISVLTMIVNVIICLALIPRYGILLAAFCAMASYFFMLSLHVVTVKFVLKSNVFDWKAMLIDCAFVILMSFVSLIIVDCRWIRYILIALIMSGLILYVWKNKNLIVKGKKK